MEFVPEMKEKEMETSVLYFGSETRFQVGDLAENMGHTVRVVEILSDDSLVVRETGLNVDQRNAGQWVADPAKTRRVV
jgi:hypothetical protein